MQQMSDRGRTDLKSPLTPVTSRHIMNGVIVAISVQVYGRYGNSSVCFLP